MNQKSRKLTVLVISGLPLWVIGEKRMPPLYENVLFIIVGDGSQKTRFGKNGKKLKISKWVQFRESANREQVKEFLNITVLS